MKQLKNNFVLSLFVSMLSKLYKERRERVAWEWTLATLSCCLWAVPVISSIFPPSITIWSECWNTIQRNCRNTFALSDWPKKAAPHIALTKLISVFSLENPRNSFWAYRTIAGSMQTSCVLQKNPAVFPLRRIDCGIFAFMDLLCSTEAIRV